MSLVNAGSEVTARDKEGLTAVHCAASRGYHACVQSLVSLCGGEVEAKDNNGSTPLHYSVTLGHKTCTKILLQTFGADPNVQDLKGRRLATNPHQYGVHINMSVNHSWAQGG